MTIITLANGTKFDTVSKKRVIEETQEPEVLENVPELPVPAPRVGIKLEDLPANPRIMNGIAAAICYKLLGLNDNDIANALGCTPFQLSGLINDEAYIESYKQVVEAFVRGQEQTARDIIQRESISAAQGLVHIAKKSKKEDTRLKAISSILDRAGVVASTDMGNQSGQGLMIKIVKGDTKEEINVKFGGK